MIFQASDRISEQVNEPEASQYREAIFEQYKLPDVSVSILTVLRYATPLESGIQFVGSIMAVAAGPWFHFIANL